jgi:hypothetical protein
MLNRGDLPAFPERPNGTPERTVLQEKVQRELVFEGSKTPFVGGWEVALHAAASALKGR